MTTPNEELRARLLAAADEAMDCGLETDDSSLLREAAAALARQEEGREAESPEDLFEHFVQTAIAKSPEPLRALGEYLGRVLDEDEWPNADRLLLQLATSFAALAPHSGGDGDAKCGVCNEPIRPDALTGTICACATDTDEDYYVIQKLSGLLAEIAVALKGPNPANGLWSYHDLPAMVRELKGGTAWPQTVVVASGGMCFTAEWDGEYFVTRSPVALATPTPQSTGVSVSDPPRCFGEFIRWTDFEKYRAALTAAGQQAAGVSEAEEIGRLAMQLDSAASMGDERHLRVTVANVSEKLLALQSTAAGAAPEGWVEISARIAEDILRGPLANIPAEEHPPKEMHAQHLAWMCMKLAAKDVGSATKCCRWLGYVQGAMVEGGWSTLDEEKERNKRFAALHQRKENGHE